MSEHMIVYRSLEVVSLYPNWLVPQWPLIDRGSSPSCVLHCLCPCESDAYPMVFTAALFRRQQLLHSQTCKLQTRRCIFARKCLTTMYFCCSTEACWNRPVKFTVVLCMLLVLSPRLELWALDLANLYGPPARGYLFRKL